MKISIKSSKPPAKSQKNTQVFFLFKDKKNSPPPKELESAIKELNFKGEKKDQLFLPLAPKNFLLIGLGDENSFDYEEARKASARMFKQLKNYNQSQADVMVESLVTKNSPKLDQLCQALTEGALLASYQYDKFKIKKEDSPFKPEIFLCVDSKQQASCKKALEEGEILAHAVNFARNLGNQPGNFMTPALLAQAIKTKTEKTKINTTIWDKKRIQKEKMGGLLGVALGSNQEPRFIIMNYQGGPKKQKPVILVGKGLTFDSGGISLKPGQNMDEMKFDMCGSIAVTGAMLAIEKLGLKVNVMGLIASSENMPGPDANKPGDILTARNGKTMEVLNTDAEGRLILADALSYASEQKPQVIFDAATLTGAIVASLGNLFTGFFTKNEELVERVQKASQKTGERVWRLPLVEEHTEDMKSVLADVANLSSTKGAGSSTAAAFLEHFVDKKIPWVHFDIAGTAYNVDKRLDYCSAKMASGVMVRTFVQLARSYEV